MHRRVSFRGHLLKREVWERPAATLYRGGGVQIEKKFQTIQLTMQQYPEPPKTALKCGNAHKIANISFIIYYAKNHNFPYFWQLFLYFSLEVWKRRSHAFRRCGYSVPTRSLRKLPLPTNHKTWRKKVSRY